MPRKQIGNIGNAEGNTKLQRAIPSKRWCFTWNNYLETDLVKLQETFDTHKLKYIIGREVGENGTPHLQGYIECDTKIRPIEKFKTKHVHWESCRGTREQNVEYCAKDGDYVCRELRCKAEMRKSLRLPTELYEWQQEVIDIVSEVPDDRKIHWYWDKRGNTGKTTLAKLLVYDHRAIVVGGKNDNILHGATEFVREDKTYDKYIFIIDLSRTMEHYVCYEAIEKLKNGLWFSGKYESGMILIPPPHVIIFANYEPQYERLSLDRWHIGVANSSQRSA